MVSPVTVSYGMAGFLALGGLYAYGKTRSEQSLYASLVFAAVFASGGYLTATSSGNLGILISLVASGGLAALMYGRYSNSRKFMPAGMLAAVGAAGAVYFGGYLLGYL